MSIFSPDSRLAALMLACFLAFASTAIAETVSTSWGGDAALVYDTGFMHQLMRAPEGGVRLFNMDLVENDSPGSGMSEKGVTTDDIFGKNHARKILNLDDPRAEKAWLVLFPCYQSGKYPLRFTVNGREASFPSFDTKGMVDFYRWTEFPAEYLKKGKNIIDLSYPEAKTAAEGWKILIARADEFTDGGGDPKDVGKTSFKSTDGGESWKESFFGPLGQDRAEYSIRISLDRFVKTGWLASPVIDLWKGDSPDMIVPQRGVKKMKLSLRSEVPAGTKVEYYLRKGSNPRPFSEEWGQYQFIGEGASVDFETGGADLNRRYIQFRAVLSTTNPLISPVVKSAKVSAELDQRGTLYKNIRVVSAVNPPIKYSSIDWKWEQWDRPEFAELRQRESLDEVIAGSRTEFNAQVRLLDHVTKRWRHGNPIPEYPGWGARDILDRIDNAGGGGMCIQFNNTLAGLCIAYGWQARHVNCVGHEICEVWNDEFGKWIFLDADYENHYMYDPKTDEPQDMLELHRLSMDYYFPDRPIDWMKDLINWFPPIEGKAPPVLRGSLSNHKGTVLTGFNSSAFIRIMPRNNYYGELGPRPVSHGVDSTVPWDGFIVWYDDRTPPSRQFSRFTDRPRDMWPDLNKVHVDITQGFGNDRLFLRFETYTPNFSHFEVNADDTGWKEVGERWTWLLQSGKNTVKVRAVNKLGVKGKASSFVVNFADAPFGE